MNRKLLLLLLCALGSFVTLCAQSLVWSRTFTRINSAVSWNTNTSGTSIAIGKDGSVYTTGVCQDLLDFDPGPDSFLLDGFIYDDVFISKLDAQGKFQWAKRFGTSQNDKGTAIALDENGNVYVTGYFSDSMDADPDTSKFILPSMASWNIFLSKFNSDGKFLWAKELGGHGFDQAYSLHVKAGYIYLTGCFSQTADFDPNADTASITVGSNQTPFVCKLDTAGNYVWAQAFLGTGQGTGISTDSLANVYIAGNYKNTMDFDPGIKTFFRTSSGQEDIFVTKLNSSGNLVWAKTFGGTSYDYGMDLTTDRDGNVLTSGFFTGNVDFDPGTDTAFQYSSPGQGIFVQKLNGNGQYQWSRKFLRPLLYQDYRVKTDADNNVYLAGTFSGKTDFNPGKDTAYKYANGASYVKLDAHGNYITAGVLAEPNSNNIYGFALALDALKNVYLSGSFKDYQDFDAGPDTFMMRQSQYGSFHITKMACASKTVTSKVVCRNYQWNDWTISKSGLYRDTFTNISGCDSMVRLYLTVNQGKDSTIRVVACDSFSFRNRIIRNDTLVMDTTKGITICDSVTFRHFIIEKINPEIKNNFGVLTALPAGFHYQWIDCSDSFKVLEGDTDQIFYAKKAGEYMVQISGEACSRFSDCEEVITIPGSAQSIGRQLLRVYPNPAQSIIFISLPDSDLSNCNMHIYDTKGDLVATIKPPSSRTGSTATADISALEPGVYLVQVEHNAQKLLQYFIKN